MTVNTRCALILAWLSSSCILTGPAWGQTAAQSTEEAAPAGAAAGEIVVTAQKRSESIQRVAASITALSGEALVERGLSGAESLAAQVPGLQYSEHANSTLFAIRGISLDILTGAGEPSVATHIDGVYQPRATAPLLDLTDVERVEVLRGPQGTLYGRNATGGTINFISAAPTKDLQAGITVGAGSFDQRLVRGYVSGPIIGDAVRARLAASYDENDGAFQDQFGERLDGRKRTYVHGSVSIGAGGPLSVDLSGYYIREKMTGPIQALVQQGPFFELVFPDQEVSYTTEPYRVFIDYMPRTVRDLKLFTGRVSWEISDDLTLRSITGYADSDYRTRFDGDSTTLNYIAVGDPTTTGPRTGDSRSFSQELNLSGNLGPLEFVAGLFYFHEKFKPFVAFNFPVGIPGAATPNTNFYAKADERTDSYAAFADLTYHVTDRFRVVGGLRGSKDRKIYDQTFGFSLPGFPLGTGPGMACVNERYKESWSSLTPKAGLQFDANSRTMLYAQYQKGNKSGAFNLTVCGNKVDPENVSSFEIGLKSRVLENTLTLNLSAFHYDYKDLQVLRFVTVGGVDTSILDNAATAKVDGFELEAAARPSPRVGVNVAFSYLDARYSTFFAGTGVDYSGNRLNRAPEFTVKSGAEYRLPLTGFFSELTLRGELNLTSRVYFSPDNSRSLSQESVAIVNAYATLASENGIEARVFGRNLSNVAVLANAFPSSTQNAVQGFYGLPRTWGIELSKRF